MQNLDNKAVLAGLVSLAMLAGCNETAETSAAEEGEGDPVAEGMVHATADAHMAVHDAIEAGLEGVLDKTQVRMLEHVAYQQAVAMHCEGFEVDPERFQSEMNRIHYNADGTQMDITQAELHELEKKALLGFGLSLGSQVTLAQMDLDGFCSSAEEERIEDDPVSIWTTTAAPAEGEAG